MAFCYVLPWVSCACCVCVSCARGSLYVVCCVSGEGWVWTRYCSLRNGGQPGIATVMGIGGFLHVMFCASAMRQPLSELILHFGYILYA